MSILIAVVLVLFVLDAIVLFAIFVDPAIGTVVSGAGLLRLSVSILACGESNETNSGQFSSW